MNRPSIIQPYNDECYLCSRGYELSEYYCFDGNMRAKAVEDGLTVMLCQECMERARKTDEVRNNLRWMAQTKYELFHSRREFIERYGINCIKTRRRGSAEIERTERRNISHPKNGRVRKEQ